MEEIRQLDPGKFSVRTPQQGEIEGYRPKVKLSEPSLYVRDRTGAIYFREAWMDDMGDVLEPWHTPPPKPKLITSLSPLDVAHYARKTPQKGLPPYVRDIEGRVFPRPEWMREEHFGNMFQPSWEPPPAPEPTPQPEPEAASPPRATATESQPRRSPGVKKGKPKGSRGAAKKLREKIGVSPKVSDGDAGGVST